jgi:uncharacterized protein YjiS (DUF1127 family)
MEGNMHTITSRPIFAMPRGWRRNWLRPALAGLLHRLAAWERNFGARVETDQADPRMLADIGLSPAQAEFELERTRRLKL